jgi:hypothetical protein
MSDARREVLWFGAAPSAIQTREIENRRGIVRHCDAAPPPAMVASARAAVVSFVDGATSPLLALTDSLAAMLVDHGLRVDLMSPDDATTGSLQVRLGAVAALPGVRVHTAPAPAELAEAIARHDAGPVPRLDLKIFVAENREPLRKADEILFQRAFAHCSEITLVELAGGRSDARVFAVHMVVARSNAGAWPQPAFAKLDRRDKIAREHDNYREFAARFIPFGLRPNVEGLVPGSDRSLLVGDFVDRSESLWDLARRNVAGSAITALLEETLGGWRDQGYAQDPVHGAVASAMRETGLWDPDKIQPGYVERAREQGIHATPRALAETLCSLSQRYREAPIHGDLHGENVRVRGNSAILIDLASVCRGPLTADLAALETWLAFELPPDVDKRQFEDPAWFETIERLYAPAAFRHPPGPCRPAAPLAWIATVVRQVRTMGIAIQSCATEYQSAVAVQLLRRCQWDDGPAADRYRRCVGYRIAAALAADAAGADR